VANRRIVCITKHPTHQDRYHRITYVGVGTNADKASERLDVAMVIRNIKSPSGDRYYVTGSDGSEAGVIVRKCPHCGNGHEVIATTADSTKKDNLLELRECSWR
jgi:hypothetical protein